MPTIACASWLPVHRRAGRLRALVAASLLALVAPACAPGGETDLAVGPATELADGAETLAGLLDDDAACEAIEQAEALLVQARDAQATGEVPDDVVARVEHVTARVTDEVTCEPAPVDDGGGEPAEDEGNGDEGNGDEGNGDEGNGNGNGDDGNDGNGNDGNEDDGDEGNGNGNDGKGNGKEKEKGNEGKGRGGDNKGKG